MKNSFFQFPEKNLFFIISVCKVIKNSAPSKESAEKMVRVALFSGSVLLKEGHTAVHDTAFRDLRYAISWVLVRRLLPQEGARAIPSRVQVSIPRACNYDFMIPYREFETNF